MTRNVIAFTLFLVFTVPLQFYAQDGSFTQFYANPLYLNPALTGNTECGRVNLNYRNQWPSLDKAYITYSVAYDQSLPGIKSGFGVVVMSDKQGNGAYNRTMAGGFYSYKLQISKEAILSFGMKGAFYQESVDWSKLVFPDMIEPISGNIVSGNETAPVNPTIITADFGAGLVFGLRDVFFAGVSADHLNQPELSFYDTDNNKMQMKIAAHAGFNFNATNGTAGTAIYNDILIQPNILYLQQGDFKHLNLGVYVSKSPIITGIWYRHAFENADAIAVLVGLKYNNLQFGYSYDFTLSELSGRSGGAHELSLSWDFCIYTDTKRTIRTIKSPSF